MKAFKVNGYYMSLTIGGLFINIKKIHAGKAQGCEKHAGLMLPISIDLDKINDWVETTEEEWDMRLPVSAPTAAPMVIVTSYGPALLQQDGALFNGWMADNGDIRFSASTLSAIPEVVEHAVECYEALTQTQYVPKEEPMGVFDNSLNTNPDMGAWADEYKRLFPASNRDNVFAWFCNVAEVVLAPAHKELAETKKKLSDLLRDYFATLPVTRLRPKQKLTSEYMRSQVLDNETTTGEDGTVTTRLRMKNGHVITGVLSATLAKQCGNERAKQIAHDRAIAQLWELEGYLLAQTTYDYDQAADYSREIPPSVKTTGYYTVSEALAQSNLPLLFIGGRIAKVEYIGDDDVYMGTFVTGGPRQAFTAYRLNQLRDSGLRCIQSGNCVSCNKDN